MMQPPRVYRGLKFHYFFDLIFYPANSLLLFQWDFFDFRGTRALLVG